MTVIIKFKKDDDNGITAAYMLCEFFTQNYPISVDGSPDWDGSPKITISGESVIVNKLADGLCGAGGWRV
ncbi:hypothetical protein FACS1894201_06840 [Bacteroidia bacterium]|nr:hypothetical protein FACS1894201_06840 [Bacteroidia bacterium]